MLPLCGCCSSAGPAGVPPWRCRAPRRSQSGSVTPCLTGLQSHRADWEHKGPSVVVELRSARRQSRESCGPPQSTVVSLRLLSRGRGHRGRGAARAAGNRCPPRRAHEGQVDLAGSSCRIRRLRIHSAARTQPAPAASRVTGVLTFASAAGRLALPLGDRATLALRDDSLLDWCTCH
jgi:hypothetical protein